MPGNMGNTWSRPAGRWGLQRPVSRVGRSRPCFVETPARLCDLPMVRWTDRGAVSRLQL